MKKLVLLLVLGILIPISGMRAEGEVDLVWEADTYTPAFYEGLGHWTNQSKITLTAIPQLSGVNAQSLIYRWTKDGTVLGMNSGVNRKSLTFSDSVLSLTTEVKVDLFLEEGTEPIGTATIIIKPQEPKLLIYENSPLYGLMLNKTVKGEFSIKEDEVSFSALPMFAGVRRRDAPALIYTWSTNSADRRNGSDITFRAPDEGRGNASIKLKLENKLILPQVRDINFLIRFNEQNGF